MSRQFWSETLAWATADGTAVANSTTETVIFPNVTIPGNYLQDGRTMRLRMFGKYSTTGTPTATFKARWGGVTGTVIATTAAVTTPSSVTNALFDVELLITTRSNGSTGTVMANGEATLHTGTAGSPTDAALTAGGQTAPAAVTLDLTADTAFAVTVTWGTASASNTLTGLNYIIEALN